MRVKMLVFHELNRRLDVVLLGAKENLDNIMDFKIPYIAEAIQTFTGHACTQSELEQSVALLSLYNKNELTQIPTVTLTLVCKKSKTMLDTLNFVIEVGKWVTGFPRFSAHINQTVSASRILADGEVMGDGNIVVANVVITSDNKEVVFSR